MTDSWNEVEGTKNIIFKCMQVENRETCDKGAVDLRDDLQEEEKIKD